MLLRSAGGKAVVDSHSSTEGQAVIKTALDAFGGVTILINNAGILRDKGFVCYSLPFRAYPCHDADLLDLGSRT
jgi:NAD(P)-dependent dehydrogenase (short-subunit alcohol dehydrogenase family)